MAEDFDDPTPPLLFAQVYLLKAKAQTDKNPTHEGTALVSTSRGGANRPLLPRGRNSESDRRPGRPQTGELRRHARNARSNFCRELSRSAIQSTRIVGR